MKTLRIYSLILFISAFLFSCSKEYSVEKIVGPAGSWKFNDPAKLYVGNIDTAYIQVNGTTQVLKLLGKSTDGQQNFSLLLYTTGTFTAGTYKASLFESEFQYSSASKTIYDANQFVGEFIVTISAIGNNSITGTFSGDAADSTGTIKAITAGSFTSSINLSGSGTGGTTATGTLGASAGVCTPVTPAGTFTQGVALTSSNTATIEVSVATPGTYTISTNTVNGVNFSKTGTFTAAGTQTVVLTGSGTPVAPGNQTFNVTFGSSTCSFVINFLPGVGPATGTLGGTPGACTPVTLAGTYTQGIALASSNTATVQVNVSTAGTYTISTNTVNGVSFSKTGTFTATGVQNVVLVGTGMPVASGNQTFTVTYGSSTCTFIVNFIAGTAPATGSLGGSPGACTSVTLGGTFTQGVALTSANTVQVQVNVATVGAYTISTNTVNGVSFSKTGTFTTTGLQNVVLIGTGTPVASGAQNYTVTFGTSTCTFPITYSPASTGTVVYSCKIDGVFMSFHYDAYAETTDFFTGQPYLGTEGNQGPAGNASSRFLISLTRNNGSAITAGTYDEKGLIAINGYMMAINYEEIKSDGSTVLWGTSSNILGPNPPFTVVITSITTTRVKGTFSGKVGMITTGFTPTKTVTEGVFDLPIQ